MLTTRYLSAALGVLLGATIVTAADAGNDRYEYRHGDLHKGRWVMKPGCCANAPRPVEQRNTIRYIYPNGYQVIVYPYKNGTGYQPFWWERDGH